MSKSITKQGTKRKSQGAPPGSRNVKQPKSTIDSFFSPKVSVRLGCGLDGVTGDAKEKVLDVVLSDEQVRVLKLVVDEGKNVFFTGSAGMTLHSWGAIAPSVDNVDKLLSYIKTARPALMRWKRTQILIIDEVSMVDGHLFEKIREIAARLRKKTDRPFGSIQVGTSTSDPSVYQW
ncbi:hypothetical protein F5888DRAFT_953826 [Russula emetica]|nr:hypothetical protein F5888DRAFT_953826 [Russula emetica]